MRTLVTYLAGDISRELRWRDKVIHACKDLNVYFLSPLDDILYTTQSLAQRHKHNRTFHLEDAMKLRWCDIVFAYLSKKSKSVFSGTSWEMGYATALNKPIILVCDMTPAKRHKYELPVRMTDEKLRCGNLSEGVDLLKDIILNMQYKPKQEE